MTYDDIAAYLDEQGQRLMAVMVRQQTTQLRECRAASERTLAAYYALRERYEPRRQEPVASGKPGPMSDG
jgi:anti-sigma factor RsiW